jgi:hypothetical protein
MPYEISLYLADTRLSLAERQWAIQRYARTLDLARTYFDLKYDYGHYLKGMPKRISRLELTLPNLLAVAKSFDKSVRFFFGRKPRERFDITRLLKDLPPGHRTCAFFSDSQKRVVFWYVRLWDKVELEYPLMGVVKLEIGRHDQTEAMTMGDRICIMKDGEIQQVNDPLSLYDRPKNRFVAGFIGSPPMNFMEVEVNKRGENLYLNEGMFELRMPELLSAKVTPLAGKRVVLGIRPEDIYDKLYYTLGPKEGNI